MNQSGHEHKKAALIINSYHCKANGGEIMNIPTINHTHHSSCLYNFFLYILVLTILLTVTPAMAADPPRLNDYKAKVEAGIAESCTAVDTMYPKRPTTLNLLATYYDGAKVLTELINLYGSTSIGGYDVSTCLSQASEINAERYIDTFPNEAGFTRFPHGLMYDYITTGDTESLAGFDAIRDGTNWSQVNVTANSQIIYSREVAYAVQMYTRAHVLGRPHSSQQVLIDHFVDMAISHLEQWHTGDFLIDFERNDERSSFMVGLTMNALIEYYEWYEADPRIPPAVKNMLDGLWAQAWWPNIHDPEPSTLGDLFDYSNKFIGVTSGAFWYRMAWNEPNQEWDIIPNQLGSSADVSGDTSMLIGSAYEWYALFSGDDTYQDKALDILDGMIDMAWFGDDGRHQWEATRYMDDFIRWYRLNTGSVCDANNLNICETPTACTGAGGNWNGFNCQYLPVTNPIIGYIKPTGSSRLLPPNLYIDLNSN
jgi:hypothetical protein